MLRCNIRLHSNAPKDVLVFYLRLSAFADVTGQTTNAQEQ